MVVVLMAVGMAGLMAVVHTRVCVGVSRRLRRGHRCGRQGARRSERYHREDDETDGCPSGGAQDGSVRG
jgi:hypothetical protein